MATYVSKWSSNLQSLPQRYIVPQEERPGMPAPISKDIPVIDLGDADRGSIVQKIMKACEEFGLFQVINHGVSQELMTDAVNVGKEFFSMPPEEITKVANHDPQKGYMVYTSTGRHMARDFSFWKDTLQHPCHPLETSIDKWPEKPAKYREIIGPYTAEVRKLGIRILNLIYEALGLSDGKFEECDMLLMIHNYPPCPDPSSTLGLCGHLDGTAITLLQQEVYGLQILKDGKWLGVEPVPNAFVMNLGFPMEVISNGRLKAAVHRAITSSDYARTTLANFVNFGSDHGIIEPAKSLVTPSHPQVFRGFHFKDYLEFLSKNNGDTLAAAEYFKIRSQTS